MEFNPNKSTIAKCLQELQVIQKDHGIDPKSIVTSRDPVVQKLAYTDLGVRNVPAGFTKTMLPIHLKSESTLYISAAAPGAVAPKHSHDEGDGIRFMISGSIHYGGKELRQGDWMFVPAGVPYEFEVGPQGAVMCYCYCCCCA